jgi:L-ascorbate metabolism protein UlaG (beta-lactamase superfamily)
MRAMILTALLIGLGSILEAGSALAQDATKGAGKRATVWFLNHSGFAVRTANHFLVFDSRNDEPPPGEPKGPEAGIVDAGNMGEKTVLVFVSHGHGDHFDPPLLLQLRKRFEKAKFILPEGLAQLEEGLAEELGPSLVEASPNAEVKVGEATIFPIAATDEGLGYWVKVDGLTLFHAGDHALWAEPCKSAFEEEIGKVAGRGPIDIAFLPLHATHPNLETIRAGALWAANALKPVVVVPMHLFGKLDEGARFAEFLRESKCLIPVAVPTARGQRFEYDGASLQSGSEQETWSKLLQTAFKEDKGFLSQLKEAAGTSSPEAGFDEASWKEQGSVSEIAAGDLSPVLSRDLRFYDVRGGVFKILSKPETVLTVGIFKEGGAFLVNATTRKVAGLPRLAECLKPVKQASDAIAAASLAARLMAYCKTCNREDGNVRVDAGKCKASKMKSGGFEVLIPKDASTSKSGESVTVVFDGKGNLKEIKFKPCPHK